MLSSGTWNLLCHSTSEVPACRDGSGEPSCSRTRVMSRQLCLRLLTPSPCLGVHLAVTQPHERVPELWLTLSHQATNQQSLLGLSMPPQLSPFCPSGSHFGTLCLCVCSSAHKCLWSSNVLCLFAIVSGGGDRLREVKGGKPWEGRRGAFS